MFTECTTERLKKKKVFTLYVKKAQCRDRYRLKPVFFWDNSVYNRYFPVKELGFTIIDEKILYYNKGNPPPRHSTHRYDTSLLHVIKYT